MKQATQNTFNEGLQMDLNELTTPNNVLTDNVNGTIIAFNGNEFVLQNDMGNCKVERAKLTPGFVPLGMKEYGGIIYVVSYNPLTGEGEVGSFPSPERDFNTTDFTELSPVNFKDSQFILETDTTTEKSTKQVGKLFEPELFELHPGDKYVITYHINDPAGSSSDEVLTKSDMDKWISSDVENRKLFRLKFYKITSNNNLVELNPKDMKVVSDQADIENEYTYFKEASNATLAVGLEVETLDYFDANVIDTSRKTDPNKKVTIEAVGYSNSIADFEGVKVNINSPENRQFYINKNSSRKKVSAVVDELDANTNFECMITPYSKYCLYPSLAKKFKLTLGSYLSGTGVNDIYRYYLDPSGYLKVDFDFKFEGNSTEGVHLYVEFYDPWSDYSIVKRVDNPTYYGTNWVIMGLVDEPAIDVYDSSTVGGTPASKLVNNPDTVYEKTLLNSTNKIRIDDNLRRNHFYIVRISGVDRDVDPSGNPVYVHYDFYRGLYTNDMFNDVYVAQAPLSPGDPGYVPDFNTLDFDTSKIRYSTSVAATRPQNTSTPEITIAPDFLMTGNSYYKVASDNAYDNNSYLHRKLFSTDGEYNVSLNLEGTERIFGQFKNNLLSVEFPTLLASNNPSAGVKPNIVEVVPPNQPNPQSTAVWNATRINQLLYKVNISASTSRSIRADAVRIDKSGSDYKEVSLIKSFHHFPNNNGPFTNKSAVIEFGRAPSYLFWVDPNGVVHRDYNSIIHEGSAYGDGLTPDDEDIFYSYEPYAKKHSAYWGSCINNADRLWWDRDPLMGTGNPAPGDYGQPFNDYTPHRNSILMFRNPSNGRISACRTHDLKVAIDFFNTIKVASNVSKTLKLYYPSMNSAIQNSQIKTTFQFNTASVKTTFTPVNGSKTYLSTFKFKAVDAILDFSPSVINSYITARKGTSVIVDGKQTIDDGFIPFIDTSRSSTFNLVFDDIVIDQAADSSAYAKMSQGFNDGQQDPAFISDSKAKPHGTLFSSDPSKYTNFLSKFSVGGYSNGTAIDDNQVYIYLTNPTEPTWKGYFAKGGKQKICDAPDLFVDFQIT